MLASKYVNVALLKLFVRFAANLASPARNVFLLFCFILEGVMPLCAAPPVSVKTVVRPDSRTGRLVRLPVAPVMPRVIPAELNQLVERIAAEERVEAPLVHSVILAESNYNAAAVSPKGAMGLMQLIPSTARRFGVSNTFDAADNIQGGVRYLRFLLDYYHGDYTKTIAAYNAGEGAVDRFHGVPPFAETLGYVRTVAKNLTAARQNKAPAKPPALPAGEAERHIQSRIGADGLVYYTNYDAPHYTTP